MHLKILNDSLTSSSKIIISFNSPSQNLVTTNYNTTASVNQTNLVPVPSVCVRVPLSPNLGPGGNSPSPVKRYSSLDSEVSALAVRECATRKF